MAHGYNDSLRERAVKAYESGRGTYEELGTLFGVASRTVERWVAVARHWLVGGSAKGRWLAVANQFRRPAPSDR